MNRQIKVKYIPVQTYPNIPNQKRKYKTILVNWIYKVNYEKRKYAENTKRQNRILGTQLRESGTLVNYLKSLNSKNRHFPNAF